MTELTSAAELFLDDWPVIKQHPTDMSTLSQTNACQARDGFAASLSNECHIIIYGSLAVAIRVYEASHGLEVALHGLLT